MTGQVGLYDKIPSSPAVAALARMRERGMVWEGIEELVGTHGGVLRKLMQRPEGLMTVHLRDRIFAAETALAANPRLAARGRRVFSQAERVRWMIGCLLARGWTGDWIGDQIGWSTNMSITSLKTTQVNVKTWARVEGVFKAHHSEWGPSRMSAVRAWRSGKFISDCYDWEVTEPDFRPIPGTLHPELVDEACTYQNKWKYRREQMLTEMHLVYGQWEKELCAAAALRTWQTASGQPTGTTRVCRNTSHHHSVLPKTWK